MTHRSTLGMLAIVSTLVGCGGDDTAPPSSSVVDGAVVDLGGVERDASGELDASAGDVATLDATEPPTGADGATTDAGPLDASSPDLGVSDAAPDETSPFDAGPYAVDRSETPLSTFSAITFVPRVEAGARLPLILLKHGFQLTTASYAELATRIASHGFIVVGVDTPAALFGGPTQVDERDATVAALDWALASAPFAASVDAARVAVVGHSRGGKIAMMAAAADARVGAALLLDPVNACGPGTPFGATCPDVTTDAIAGAIGVPVGVMGETTNAEGLMACAPRDQSYRTIYPALTRAPWVVAWTFEGADHMDFTDDGGGLAGLFCPDGPADDAVVRASMRALAVAFLRRHLRGDVAMDEVLVGAALPAGITREGP